MRKVTTRTLIKRINRKLRPDNKQLCATRGERSRYDLGDHYLVDQNRNFIIDQHVDVEAMGRELGVLNSSETVIDGEAA